MCVVGGVCACACLFTSFIPHCRVSNIIESNSGLNFRVVSQTGYQPRLECHYYPAISPMAGG